LLKQADNYLCVYFQEHIADEQSRTKLKEYMNYKENRLRNGGAANGGAQKPAAERGAAGMQIDTSKQGVNLLAGGTSAQD
jgi:hypothetical protein